MFRDTASGRKENRVGMNCLIKYMSKDAKNQRAVIIDDVSRLARNMEAYTALKGKLRDVGGYLISPNCNFGEDADSVLVEMLQAVVAQHASQKNQEQNKRRSRGRLLNGCWVFRPPLGYRYEPSERGGKTLKRDEPNASVIAEALEGYAYGRFESIAEVRRFLNNEPRFPEGRSNRKLTYTEVKRILNNRLYSGHVEYPKWGIPLVEGRHEGLVTLKCSETIQARLRGRRIAPNRRDTKEDFPLRGFILCEGCGRPLTAGWTKGRSKYYPYYICQRQGCGWRGKSIPRSALEEKFRSLLANIRPSRRSVAIAEEMLRDAWELSAQKQQERRRAYKRECADIKNRITKTMDKYIDTENEAVSDALLKKLDKLYRQQALAKEKYEMEEENQGTFDELFEPAMDILANPSRIWEKSPLEWKRLLLRMVFSEKVTYSRSEGFRTVGFSMAFNALWDRSKLKDVLVPPHAP